MILSFPVIKCAMPKENSNIKIMNRMSEYLYGDQVFYRCGGGHTISGPEIRTCVKRHGAAGKWSGFDPFCTGK